MTRAHTYLAPALALALAGCGGDKEQKKDEGSKTVTDPVTTPADKPEPPSAPKPGKPLSVGAEAPDFSMEAHTGETISLSQVDGPVVLYFYPKDDTPG